MEARSVRPPNVIGPPDGQNGFSALPASEITVDVTLLERSLVGRDVREPLFGKDSGAGSVVGIGCATVALEQERSHPPTSEPSLSLFQWLGLASKLLIKCIFLGLYAMLLLPGHIQVMWLYFSSKSILRNIPYGELPRNLLDLYLPESSTRPRPVVIFVAGGAWMIGNKAWGALFAKRLAERDILVASVDYRNFPKATISYMVQDISTAVAFVLRNAHMYGGDPHRVFLVGQSAGAHLAACTLVNHAEGEADAPTSSHDWRASEITAFIGISGLYNLPELVPHFQSRGLHPALLWRIMEGEASLPTFSPECSIRRPEFQPALRCLPPCHLFHGGADISVPPRSSASFASALLSLACQVTLKVYPEKTHTDMIVQDWMRGGKDELQDDVLEIVQPGHCEDASIVDRRLVPECLIQLARKVSPF